MNTTAPNSTTPATKAPSMTRTRAARKLIACPSAEARDQAGADHLEEYCRAVMCPQQDRRGERQAERAGAQDDRRARPGRQRLGYGDIFARLFRHDRGAP